MGISRTMIRRTSNERRLAKSAKRMIVEGHGEPKTVWSNKTPPSRRNPEQEDKTK